MNDKAILCISHLRRFLIALSPVFVCCETSAWTATDLDLITLEPNLDVGTSDPFRCSNYNPVINC